MVCPKKQDFWPKINILKGNYCSIVNCELTLIFQTKIYLIVYTAPLTLSHKQPTNLNYIHHPPPPPHPPQKLDNHYYHNARLAIFCNHPRLDKLAQQCTTEEGFKIGAINQSTIFLLLGFVSTIYGHFWILLITVILLVVSILILKPFQKKKVKKKFQVHCFQCFFYGWQLRKRHQKRWTWKIFWPFSFCDGFITNDNTLSLLQHKEYETDP